MLRYSKVVHGGYFSHNNYFVTVLGKHFSHIEKKKTLHILDELVRTL